MLHLTYKQLLAIVLVAGVVFVSLLTMLYNENMSKKSELNALEAQYNELSVELTSVERQEEFYRSDEGIELLAHEYGMQYSNETRYAAVKHGVN